MINFEEDLRRARELDKKGTAVRFTPPAPLDFSRPKPIPKNPSAPKYTEADIYRKMYEGTPFAKDNEKVRENLNNSGFLKGAENLLKGADPVTPLMESVDHAGRIANAAVNKARELAGKAPLRYESYDPLMRRQEERLKAREDFKKQVGNEVVGDIALSGADMLSSMGMAKLLGAGKGVAAVGKQLLKPKNFIRNLPGATFNDGYLNYLAAGTALENAANDIESGKGLGKALTHGAASGLITRATNSLGGIAQTSSGKAVMDKIGKSKLLSKISPYLSENATKYLGNGLGAFALSLIKNGAEEAGEELIEGPAQYAVEKILFGDEAAPFDVKENLYNALISGGVGALFGLPGAVGDGVEAHSRGKFENAFDEARKADIEDDAVSRETEPLKSAKRDIDDALFKVNEILESDKYKALDIGPEEKLKMAADEAGVDLADIMNAYDAAKEKETVSRETFPESTEKQGPQLPLGLPERAVLIADDKGHIGTKAYTDTHDLNDFEPIKNKKRYVYSSDADNETQKIINRYPTTIPKSDINKGIADIYQVLSDNANDPKAYDLAETMADDLAYKILSESETTDRSYYNDNEGLRNYIRNANFEISEKDASNIPDYNDWRKKHYGQFNIKKGKTNIDKIYRELSELYGGIFNADEEITPADQILKIAEVMDGVYNQESHNPFTADLDKEAHELSEEILADFFSTIPGKQIAEDYSPLKREHKRIPQNKPSTYGMKGKFVESKAEGPIPIKRNPFTSTENLNTSTAAANTSTENEPVRKYTENAEVNRLIDEALKNGKIDAKTAKKAANTLKNDENAKDFAENPKNEKTVSHETERENVYKPSAFKNKNAGLREDSNSKKYTRRARRIIDEVAKKAGVEVIFDPDLKGKNGEYDPETGTIRISTNAENPIGAVLNHEVTHRLKETDPEGFETIKNMALEQIKAEGSYEKVYGEMEKYYKAEDIDEEIVCDMMGRFADNPETFEKLCNIDRSLAQKIFDWFDEFFREGFWNESKDHTEELGRYTRGEIAQTREAWENALKVTSHTDYDNSDVKKGVKSSFKQDFEEKKQKAKDYFTPHEPLEGERRGTKGFSLNDLGSENAFKGIEELFDASFDDAVEIDFGAPEEGATANVMAHKPKKADSNAADEWDKIKRKMTDQGATIEAIGNAVEDRSLYNAFNSSRQAPQQAENAIGTVQTDLKGKKMGESLKDIFKEARSQGDEYFNSFQEYLYHHLNIDRMTAATDGRKKIQEEINSLYLKNPDLMKLSPDALLKASHGKSETGAAAKALLNLESEKARAGGKNKAAIEGEIKLLLNEHPELKGLNRNQLLEKSSERSGTAKAASDIITLQNRLKKVQNKPVFGKNVDAHRSRIFLNNAELQHPEFKKMAEKVWKFNENNLQIREDAGLISKAEHQFLSELYPHYVPAYVKSGNNPAAFEFERGTKVSKTIKRAKGNYGYDLMPIDESMASQTKQVYREARKNIFGLKLADIALKNKDKVGRWVQGAYDTIADYDIDDPSNLDSAFVIYAGGKPIELRVSQGVMDAVKEISPKMRESSKVWDKVIYGNNLYKALITGYNPAFAIKNILRDTQDAVLYSRNSKEFLKNLPRALKEIHNAEWGKPTGDKRIRELWDIYKGMGGTGTSYFDYDLGIDFDFKKKSPFGKMMDAIEKVNSNIEQGPRFAEFMTIIETVHKGDTSMESILDAMEGAADITVNFGRGGEWVRMANRSFIPFLNPSIQGTAKLARELTGKGALGADVSGRKAKQIKALKAVAVRAAFFGMAPGIFNYLLYKDDEEYKDLSDRNKDGNYLVKLGGGKWLKLPMGRNLSIANAGARRALEGNAEGYGGHIAEQVIPSSPFRNHIVSQVINTDLFNEKSPGKTWYGGDIVPQSLMNRPAEEQYDEKTDSLSVILGKAFKLSPKKINNLLSSYTGVLGDVILPVLTPAAEKGLMSSTFVIDSVLQNKIPGEFYGKVDEITKDKNSSHPSKDADVTLRFLNKAKSISGDFADQIRTIQASGISDKEKLEKVREVRTLQTAYQKSILENLEAYRKEAAANLDIARGIANKNGKKLRPDQVIDWAYRETNRNIFGAEYALKNYNKEIYEKAQKANAEGQSFEEYYEIYFYNKNKSFYEKEDKEKEEPDTYKISKAKDKPKALKPLKKLKSLKPLPNIK